jgi:uncharacterized membrane protein
LTTSCMLKRSISAHHLPCPLCQLVQGVSIVRLDIRRLDFTRQLVRATHASMTCRLILILVTGIITQSVLVSGQGRSAAITLPFPGLSVSQSSGNRPAVKYTFTYFAHPKSPNKTYFSGINNNGKIVGYFDDPRTPGKHGSPFPVIGFAFSPPYGQQNFNQVRYPNNLRTWATAINNNGVIAGKFDNFGSQQYGFIFRNRQYTSFKYPGLQENFYADLVGINDQGFAVGNDLDFSAGEPVYRPFIIDTRNGRFGVVFPTGFRKVRSALVGGVNNKGHIAGCFADTSSRRAECFLVKEKRVRNFTCPGTELAEVKGLNGMDQVVGWDQEGVGFIASDVDRNASCTFFSLPTKSGVANVAITGINDKGDVVGYIQELERFPNPARSYSFLAKRSY